MMASWILAGGVLIVLSGCATAPPASVPAPAPSAQRNSSPEASHSSCPRGGWCDAERGVCIEPDVPDRNTFGTDEWLSKAASDVPGHTPNLLHVTYDEWDSLSRHMRISFRGDGWYAIELDGISGWNRAFEADATGNERGRQLRRTGFISGRSRALPSIRSLRAASCPGNISGFRAELVMVAEFARMHAYRGVWTHPMCRDFPREYIDAIWSFVESETGGAVHRFNRDQWGPLPPGAQSECHTNYNTCCVGCPPPDEG